jgi:O-antigen/teichoic acid export membrane protein
MLSVYAILSRFFMAIDRQQVNIVTQIASTTMNVVLNLWMIPRYGIVGAAAASLASYGLEAVLVGAAFRVQGGQRLRSTFVPGREDVAVYTDRISPWLRRRTG